MSSEPDLVHALVGFAEALEQVNSRIRRDAESHADVDSMSYLNVLVIMQLMREPDTSAGEIATAVGHPVSRVQQALAVIERNGMVTVEGGGRAARYRATAKAYEIRERARDRSAQIFRYALTPLSPGARADLANAQAAIVELSRNLGYRDVADPPAE